VIQCDTPNACSDALLLCPASFDCLVACVGFHSCQRALIGGPKGADFELFCDGEASCVNGEFGSERAKDVTIHARALEAASGPQTVIDCGRGVCTLHFPGESAGFMATIRTNFAMAVFCDGTYANCPGNFVLPGAVLPTPSPTQPNVPAPSPVNVQPNVPIVSLPTPSPTNLNMGCKEGVGSPECVGSEVWDVTLCRCVCPHNTNSVAVCASLGKVLRGCQCECAESCPVGTWESLHCECVPDGQTGPGPVIPAVTQPVQPMIPAVTAPAAIITLAPIVIAKTTCSPPLGGCVGTNARRSKALAQTSLYFDYDLCRCECGLSVCPGMSSVDVTTCECVCPLTEGECAAVGQELDATECACKEKTGAVTVASGGGGGGGSTHCCLTMILDYTPWAGVCWKHTSEGSCDADAYRRCVWEPTHCLEEPVVNTLDVTKPCSFTSAQCEVDADCCSEECMMLIPGYSMCK